MGGLPVSVDVGGLALLVGMLALAQRLGGWENKIVARCLGIGAALLFITWCFLVFPLRIAIPVAGAAWSVVLWFVFPWFQKEADPLQEGNAPLNPPTIEELSKPQLIDVGDCLMLELVHVEPRPTDPTIVYYKAKVRFVFTNRCAETLRLLSPTWTAGTDRVPTAFPFASRYQLEKSLGAWQRGKWDYSLWNKQEFVDTRVDAGWTVTFYIAPSEAIPHDELVARCSNQRLGTVIIPIEVKGLALGLRQRV